MCVCGGGGSSAATGLIHCESKNLVLAYRICVCESRHQSLPVLPLFLKIKYTKRIKFLIDNSSLMNVVTIPFICFPLIN